MDAPPLEALEPWLRGYLDRLSPREQGKVARAIGAMLRKANADRIRANVQPDGSPMEPRKAQKDRRGRIRKRKGKMFPRIALARNLKVRTRPDEVEIAFTQRIAGAASVHHFGLTAEVDPRIRHSIKVRYVARRLLGFSPADRQAIMDAALGGLEA